MTKKFKVGEIVYIEARYYKCNESRYPHSVQTKDTRGEYFYNDAYTDELIFSIEEMREKLKVGSVEGGVNENKLIWLSWKLFYPIGFATCDYMYRYGYGLGSAYRDFLRSECREFNSLKALTWHYGKTIGYQKRREMMYRFLIKGER